MKKIQYLAHTAGRTARRAYEQGRYPSGHGLTQTVDRLLADYPGTRPGLIVWHWLQGFYA